LVVNKNTRSMVIWWMIIAGIVVFGIYQLFNRRDPVYQLATSNFHQYIKLGPDLFDGYLVLDEEWVEGRFHAESLNQIRAEILRSVPPQEQETHLPPNWEGEFRASRDAIDDYDIQAKLDEAGIDYNVKAPSKFPQGLLIFGTTVVPLLIFLGLMIFLSRQMQGSGNRALSFGKSRARLHSENQNKITFDDVAGVDEAKDALQEVIEFLKAPKKFERLGGRIPKGVLLMGPPGTGKTMLAQAVAGEADVPFYSISGSDFVEMFVGVGASRVRDLFETGKKNAPCIIFIDELDAVGRHRGAGIGGGHDEREQTLNQLLVEMQGFDASEGVILIAATNRPDVLDPALLRPGRFDRQIVVDLPDVRGREAILVVHTKEPYKLSDDVNLGILAKATPGFSGADLENMANEAALFAARRSKENIDMLCFDEAKDRVLMGPERRSLVISAEERRVTAYHEAGHALMLHFVPESDPNYKCTIVPRGRALGVTAKLPLEERHNMSKKRLLAHIIFALGGRVAEEIIFGEQTTGAQNDFEQATSLARRMVTQWGMSHMGPLTFGKRDEQVFLGKELAVHQDYSEKTAIEIDQAVHDIVMECYKRARGILETNMDGLKLLADALLERETLVTEDIDEILGPRPQLPAQPII
jgi:cell division protease FtsH